MRSRQRPEAGERSGRCHHPACDHSRPVPGNHCHLHPSRLPRAPGICPLLRTGVGAGASLWEQSRPDLSLLPFPTDEGLWDTFVKDIPWGATSCTISLDKLRQGVTYEFRVVAVNQVGYGEPSSPSAAVSGTEPFLLGAGG